MLVFAASWSDCAVACPGIRSSGRATQTTGLMRERAAGATVDLLNGDAFSTSAAPPLDHPRAGSHVRGADGGRSECGRCNKSSGRATALTGLGRMRRRMRGLPFDRDLTSLLSERHAHR